MTDIIIAGIIVAAAAVGLWRSLRRRGDDCDDGCADCPLASDCRKPRRKS